jgi:hypothetical protein
MAKVQFAEFVSVSSQKVRMFGEIARSHVQNSLFSRHPNLSSTHPSSQTKMSVSLTPSTSLGFHSRFFLAFFSFLYLLSL